MKDFATCISVLKKALALVETIRESCSSKTEACSFPAVRHNRGCCGVVHAKRILSIITHKGSALMGAQYLRPPDGHRGCDCDYPKCHKMGYFP